MILAIDFDGVIHDFKNPVPGRRMGPDMRGARDALDLFRRRGDQIIVFTVWGDEKGQKTIADFMNYYHLPFDKITNIKPNADYYIDDKAIKFTTWQQVLNEVKL